MKTTTSQAGFTAVEAMAGLLVFMLLLPSLYALWDNGVTEMKKQAVARHLLEVTEAATNYGRKHYNALIEQSGPGNGPTFGIEDLRREEFLSSNFNVLNPWRQSTRIFSRQPKKGELQLVVLTEGGLGHEPERPKFGNAIVPSTAALAKGGFIPTGLAGQPVNQLLGAYSAWRLDLAAMGIPSPGAGHLGAVSNLSSFDAGHDYLYRVSVPGHPELNEMWTDLDMTGNAIERIGEAQFVPSTLATMQTEDGAAFCADVSQNGRLFLHESEGLYICRNGRAEAVADTGSSAQVKDLTLAAHGEVITKPVCPEGTDTKPEIYLTPVTMAESGINATPLVAVQSWATNLSDTSWQVNLRLMTTDSKNKPEQWVYPTADYGRVMVTTVCRRSTTP